MTVQPERLAGFSYSHPSTSLPPRHFLCHEQHQSQVTCIHAAEQAAELAKQACILALTSPHNIIGILALGQVWQLGRLFAVVEELVHRDFKSASHFLKRFYRGNSVSVFDTGDV